MFNKKNKAEKDGALIPEGNVQGNAAAKETAGGKATSFLYEVVSVFITAFIILAITFTFFMRFIGVVGQSMEDTLHSTDWVFIKQAGSYTPKYGDVVVISQPNKYHENIIKRVIATEGQTIDIDFSTGKVYLDGAEIIEPYIKNATTNYYDVKFPLTVPEGCCFVMGDNRQGSVDSRSSIIGVINNSYVLGKAGYALTDNGIEDLDLYRKK